AVPKLASLLTAERALERYLAACALQSVGPSAVQAVPALQRTLNDPDPIVREAAAEALQAIEARRP
ncbi:MAG TPA: HEAT repeat domain-containing protein, partial [Nitrospira sp.]|nr:HEAT repeat domain-containing protein [Nitrospira sp.]